METSLNWNVLYTRSRNEKKVADRLMAAGLEVFCPTISLMKQWSDRKKKVTEPLFKSYVFVRLMESQRLEVLQVPGVVSFVFWLGQPARVRPEEIEAIRVFTEEVEGTSSVVFEKNDPLVIDWGLFKGREGQYIARQGDHLILLVESLGQVIKAAVPVAHVRKVG